MQRREELSEVVVKQAVFDRVVIIRSIAVEDSLLNGRVFRYGLVFAYRERGVIGTWRSTDS